MRIGPSDKPGADLRMTHWDDQGTLIIDMSWDDWDEIAKDAEYLRKHGRPRFNAPSRISPQGNDMDGHALWVPPGSG